MKNKTYATPIVAVSKLNIVDIVRTSSTSDTLEFDANGFIEGGVQ